MRPSTFLNIYWHHRTFNRVFVLKVAVLCSVWVTTFEQQPLEKGFKERDSLAACLDSFNLLTSENHAMSVTSKEDMDKLCEKIKQHLDCIENETKRSMTPEARLTFKVLYNSTTVVMTELCHNVTYQREFFKRNRCIKDVKNDECEQKHLETLQEIQKNKHVENAWQRICCSLQEYQQCSKLAVAATCGHETGEFYMKMMDAMSTSLKQQCQQVTNVTDMCQAMNLATRSFGEVMWLQVLLVALIAVLSTLRL